MECTIGVLGGSERWERNLDLRIRSSVPFTFVYCLEKKPDLGGLRIGDEEFKSIDFFFFLRSWVLEKRQ